jgi:hypothetical protein
VPYSPLKVYRPFERTSCFRVKGWRIHRVTSRSETASTDQKAEATPSSETSAEFQRATRVIPRKQVWELKSCMHPMLGLWRDMFGNARCTFYTSTRPFRGWIYPSLPLAVIMPTHLCRHISMFHIYVVRLTETIHNFSKHPINLIRTSFVSVR